MVEEEVEDVAEDEVDPGGVDVNCLNVLLITKLCNNQKCYCFPETF